MVLAAFLGAAERGFGQSVLGVWGTVGALGVWEKEGGPFASLRFPDSGTSMLGHGTGPLDAARRMLPIKYRVVEQEENGPNPFGLGWWQAGTAEGGGGGRGGWWCA